MHRSLLLLPTFLAFSMSHGEEKPTTQHEQWHFLDNGKIRLGMNLTAGAAVGWFSRTQGPNVLNTFDHGRYVQQSFYGDEDGSTWNGQPWRYNPVQGGSWKNEPSTLLEHSTKEGVFYAKTKPRQWASGKDVADMVFEQWIELQADLAVLKFRMTYTGTATHAPRHQELPAVFLEPRFATLVYTAADQPNGLTRRQPGFPNEYAKFTEPWAAWEDAQGQACGLYFPHTTKATLYRVTNTGKGDCSYLAPIRTISLTPGCVVEHKTTLTLGTVEQIRTAFQKLAGVK